MAQSDASEALHRLAKAELDRGAADTPEAALAKLQGYKLHVALGSPTEIGHAEQIALLTTVALARRVFLGGVTVSGVPDVPTTARVPVDYKLPSAVEQLGGRLAAEDGEVCIQIGRSRCARRRAFHVRPVFRGWCGGVLPIEDDYEHTDAVMPLSSMLAAALAVSEAFAFVRDGGVAGCRPVGLSLWSPASTTDWLSEVGAPPLTLLPSKLWLLGLGHLGQAFLWALGLLPYPDPSQLHLVLQDKDRITEATESTSVLSDQTLVGQMKTRAMAAWAERRGFSTAIVERWFDGLCRRRDDEPGIALCGLDNADGRRVLDQVGFDFIVEAGLGRGYDDFRRMRLHTLPGARPAAVIWPPRPQSDERDLAPAYQRMIQRREVDRCGATLLAGKAVGAPFVGAVAACLVISEVLRLLHQGPLHHVADVDLEALDQRAFVPHATTFDALNPGFISLQPS